MTLLQAPKYGQAAIVRTVQPDPATGRVEVGDPDDVAALLEQGYTVVDGEPPPAGGEVAPPAGYTAAQKLFEDRFTTPSLDGSKWHPWLGDAQYGRWGDRGALPSPYSAANHGSYQIQYNDPYPYGHGTRIDAPHLVGGEGNLTIIATPSDHFDNYSWVAAAISSYGLMELPTAGGYVQVRAKMPDCRHGAWPAFWLMATGGIEIDLHEGGYLRDGIPVNNALAANFHADGAQQVVVNAGVDLTAGYHVWGCEYRSGRHVKIYFDGREIASYTKGIPSNVKYELIIDLEIAGPLAEGWRTIADAAHPGPFTFDISHVQLYRLP